MKKLTLTTAVFMALTATNVFAHHPSQAPDATLEMIEENLEGSPHLEMDYDDIMGMGAAEGAVAGNSAMEQAERFQSGPMTSQAGVEPPTEPVTTEDTFILLEEID
jgi:hypothetical protein